MLDKVLRRAGAAIVIGGVALFVVAGSASATPKLTSTHVYGNNNNTPNGGDNNAGDVWTDMDAAQVNTGHEDDPMLSCGTIDLWGDGMADSSGSFTIVAGGWDVDAGLRVDMELQRSR